MKITITLNRDRVTDLGHPLELKISHQGKRKQLIISHAKLQQWNLKTNLPLQNHPAFMELYEQILLIKERALSLRFKGLNDLDDAMGLLLNDGVAKQDNVDFYNYVSRYFTSFNGAGLGKDSVSRRGNIAVYKNAVKQMVKYYPDFSYSDFDYKKMYAWKMYLLERGLSLATVSNYLRTIRALYNEMCRATGLENRRPFENVFTGLKRKSYRSKKKHLSRIGILRLILKKNITETSKKYVDMWMLQFYFGGADLMDIYYLKNEDVQGGRVSFWRGKMENSPLIDLKIHSQALEIIDRYRQDGEYVFPWRKDVDGYRSFRGNMYRDLIKFQVKNNVQVHPGGGKLGLKVARHSFATLAKNSGVPGDIRREIMGHTEDNVANFYEDLHKVEKRDAGLFKVIDFIFLGP